MTKHVYDMTPSEKDFILKRVFQYHNASPKTIYVKPATKALPPYRPSALTTVAASTGPVSQPGGAPGIALYLLTSTIVAQARHDELDTVLQLLQTNPQSQTALYLLATQPPPPAPASVPPIPPSNTTSPLLLSTSTPTGINGSTLLLPTPPAPVSVAPLAPPPPRDENLQLLPWLYPQTTPIIQTILAAPPPPPSSRAKTPSAPPSNNAYIQSLTYRPDISMLGALTSSQVPPALVQPATPLPPSPPPSQDPMLLLHTLQGTPLASFVQFLQTSRQVPAKGQNKKRKREMDLSLLASHLGSNPSGMAMALLFLLGEKQKQQGIPAPAHAPVPVPSIDLTGHLLTPSADTALLPTLITSAPVPPPTSAPVPAPQPDLTSLLAMHLLSTQSTAGALTTLLPASTRKRSAPVPALIPPTQDASAILTAHLLPQPGASSLTTLLTSAPPRAPAPTHTPPPPPPPPDYTPLLTLLSQPTVLYTPIILTAAHPPPPPLVPAAGATPKAKDDYATMALLYSIAYPSYSSATTLLPFVQPLGEEPTVDFQPWVTYIQRVTAVVEEFKKEYEKLSKKNKQRRASNMNFIVKKFRQLRQQTGNTIYMSGRPSKVQNNISYGTNLLL